MIAKLTGTLDSATDDSAVVDVGGVGYLVFCPARTLAVLPAPGGAVSLLVETHVREDHIHLYGFASTAGREWFRLLLTVQGVGAKVALAILSVLSEDDLSAAIFAEDRAALTRANGVGNRVAQRVIGELREKVAGIATLAGATGGLPAAALAGAAGAGGAPADAISALVNLGYGRTEAVGAVAQAAREAGEAASAEALIRAGLRELGS